jgi:hypothetical protein
MFLPAQMCKTSAQRLIECWLMQTSPVGADRVARRQPANGATHRPLFLHAQGRSHRDVGSLPQAAHAFRRPYCAASERSLHCTATALTQNSATPRMKLVGEWPLTREVTHWRTQHSANSRRKNVCVSRRERGLLKRSEHCSGSLERGLASRHKLRLTRPFCANWMSLLPLMTNNHTFNDRRSYRATRVLLAPAL